MAKTADYEVTYTYVVEEQETVHAGSHEEAEAKLRERWGNVLDEFEVLNVELEED